MCLIVRGRIGDLLSLDLTSAQVLNSDGWGIHTARNLAYSFSSPEKDIVKFLSRKRMETVATIHFRFATHGTVNLMNAHPFTLGEKEFLMHNGVLHGEHFEHKTESDTMRLAEILRDAGPLARDYILSSLVETEWYSNRFCVLKGNTWTKFGDWHYDKASKTWHSNRTLLGGYKSFVPTKKGIISHSALDDDETCGDYEMKWDKGMEAWVPKTPAASVTRGHIYDIDEDELYLQQIDPFYSKSN